MAAWITPGSEDRPQAAPAPARTGLDFPPGFIDELLPSAPLEIRLAELRPQRVRRFERARGTRRFVRSR
jgi:hypothetical protein